MEKDVEPDNSGQKKEDEDPKWAAEDPAVFGGSSSSPLAEGTVVEFGQKRGYRVIKKPDE